MDSEEMEPAEIALAVDEIGSDTAGAVNRKKNKSRLKQGLYYSDCATDPARSVLSKFIA